MPFEVQKLPDEPIVICSVADPFKVENDYEAIFDTLDPLLDGLPGPIYRILDIRHLTLDFSGLLVAMAVDTKSDRPGSLRDPRVRPVLVASGDLAMLAVESAKQPQYGQINSPLFASLDDALAYIRGEIAKEQP